MNNKKNIDTSKFLSYILRHAPESIGLALDKEGWASIDQLIAAAARHGRNLNHDLIAAVVRDNDKKRFSISPDGTRLRAVQGHTSDSVDIQHIEKAPPEFLYHGTATRFLASIQQQGLIPGSRHHVHLSQDISTAISVGQRYGKPVVLKIAADKMRQAGHVFFQADNGVWLTAHVPVEFFALDPVCV